MEEDRFMGLITSFSYACWQQLGKIANPITGKIERNLEQAKYSIDLLLMLREKTKGNLTKDEEKLLNEMIANLQMNYVDELKKPSPSNEGLDKPSPSEQGSNKPEEKKDEPTKP